MITLSVNGKEFEIENLNVVDNRYYFKLKHYIDHFYFKELFDLDISHMYTIENNITKTNETFDAYVELINPLNFDEKGRCANIILFSI